MAAALWRVLTFLPRAVAGLAGVGAAGAEEEGGAAEDAGRDLEAAAGRAAGGREDDWARAAAALRRGGVLLLLAVPAAGEDGGGEWPEPAPDADAAGDRAWLSPLGPPGAYYEAPGAWLAAHGGAGRGRPGAVHALARVLADRGRLLRVCTAGQDGLALEAGVPGPLVVEAAGSLRSFECDACRARYDPSQGHLAACVAGARRPWCTRDGCGALLRPSAAFRGEPLAPRYHAALAGDAAGARAVLLAGRAAAAFPSLLAAVPPGVPRVALGGDAALLRLAADAGLEDAVRDALAAMPAAAAPLPAQPQPQPQPQPRLAAAVASPPARRPSRAAPTPPQAAPPAVHDTVTPAKSLGSAPRPLLPRANLFAAGSPSPSPPLPQQPLFGGGGGGGSASSTPAASRRSSSVSAASSLADNTPILTVAAALERERASRDAERERRLSQQRKREWEDELRLELERQRAERAA